MANREQTFTTRIFLDDDGRDGHPHEKLVPPLPCGPLGMSRKAG